MKKQKYTLLICLIFLITLVTILFLLPPQHHYNGIALVTLPQATKLAQDKGVDNDVQVFTYNPMEDKVYVKYSFTGDMTDFIKYGIPSGYPKSKIDAGTIALLIAIALATYGTIRVWWLERVAFKT